MGNCFGSSSLDSYSSNQHVKGYVSGNSSRGSLESSSYGYKKHEEAKEIEIEEEEKKMKQECYTVRVFSFNDLKAATRNFRPDSFLGQGGFGSVFKGWIDEKTFKAVAPGSGIQIAVKQLDNEGSQGDKEWMTEIFYLSQFRHPHLVKLIGYCSEAKHRLLVYEFMPNGSMESKLFCGKHRQPLSWERRLKVVMGAAKGLAFLHSLEPCVIYRDFKSSNVLLDSDFNAKLSDFGLAKEGPTGEDSHVTTRVIGTYGYAAPEYIATGHLTTKNDVYGFGVVLLEILTGRKAVDNNRSGGEQNLVQWAIPFLRDKSKVLRLVDTRLEGQYSRRGALRLAHVALRCINPKAKDRPHMHQVVELLEPAVERGCKDMRSPRTHNNDAHQYQKQTVPLPSPCQDTCNDVKLIRDHPSLSSTT